MEDQDIPPGEILAGNYRIDSLIGRGGLGSVYRAWHLALHKAIAVKVLHEHFSNDPEARQRFVQEARIAADFRNPFLVTVHAVGEDRGRAFLVMDLVEGQTLAQRLEKEGPLPWKEVQSLFEQVLQGLQYAHERGIVHRDLKPANLFICADGSAKIVDMGTAKILEWAGSQPLAHRLTVAGVPIGTPSYMSPEQAAGQPVDARSDIYSLGCTMFESLAGRPPYSGNSVFEVAFKQAYASTPHMVLPDGNTCRKLNYVVERAMRKKPEARFQSAAEMRQSLCENAVPIFYSRISRNALIAGLVLGVLVSLCIALWLRPGRSALVDEERRYLELCSICRPLHARIQSGNLNYAEAPRGIQLLAELAPLAKARNTSVYCTVLSDLCLLYPFDPKLCLKLEREGFEALKNKSIIDSNSYNFFRLMYAGHLYDSGFGDEARKVQMEMIQEADRLPDSYFGRLRPVLVEQLGCWYYHALDTKSARTWIEQALPDLRDMVFYSRHARTARAHYLHGSVIMAKIETAEGNRKEAERLCLTAVKVHPSGGSDGEQVSYAELCKMLCEFAMQRRDYRSAQNFALAGVVAVKPVVATDETSLLSNMLYYAMESERKLGKQAQALQHAREFLALYKARANNAIDEKFNKACEDFVGEAAKAGR